MHDGLLFLLTIAYFIVAYIVTSMIYKYVRFTPYLMRFIILSFTYSLFFGIGAIGGGGGKPGFALHSPVILAAWDSKPEHIINNAVIPFFFWWGFIFVIMVSLLGVRIFLTKRKEIN